MNIKNSFDFNNNEWTEYNKIMITIADSEYTFHRQWKLQMQKMDFRKPPIEQVNVKWNLKRQSL